MHNFVLPVFLILSLFTLQAETFAQTPIEFVQSGSAVGGHAPSSAKYHYLFENERFTTPLQEVEFDGNGNGKFRYKRKDGDEIVNSLSVSPTVLVQLQMLFDELNFLSSSEEYQHKKDFSHLGTVTITLARSGKERSVKFNYTDNSAMTRLREIFQNIATQETRIFEMETVRSTDPISMPAQLRLLESELRSKHIADPERFVPMLKDLKLDESVPLIARNHAEKILQSIKKGK